MDTMRFCVYVDIFVVVSFVSSSCSHPSLIQGQYIYFDDVEINFETPFEHIIEGNCNFFLEFMHHKIDKKKNSCRCWGLIEKSELLEDEVRETDNFQTFHTKLKTRTR